MQYNPYIWLLCVIILLQLIFYTWLDNSKQYRIRSKLTRLAFRYGWIINLLISVAVLWAVSTFGVTNNLEIGMQMILAIGTSVGWVFWIMCKDSAPYYKK